MKFRIEPSRIRGSMDIPPSKSHTIRALVISSLADGISTIKNPLSSLDTLSCVTVMRAFGADIKTGKEWTVQGTAGDLQTPDDVINVGNSGTTLYLTMSTAALSTGCVVFTGDEQIRRRPGESLLDALTNLGATAFSTQGNGMPPFIIRGPLTGGKTVLSGMTSQYTSSLLLNAPLARGDVEFTVEKLNEKPYVRMTMDWLDHQGIEYSEEEMKHFSIRGRQSYHAFDRAIPGDFSSATFFLCAGALSPENILLRGLDMNDSQGDKIVVNILQDMGATITSTDEGLSIQGGKLRGRTIDMNSIPDALPAMAVTACFAEGTTRLENVPQARYKETDRIRVMREELEKMGGKVEELQDGLIIEGTGLQGASIHGHGDHRVVMALSIAGLFAQGTTEVDTAESTAITFPDFIDLVGAIGGAIYEIDE